MYLSRRAFSSMLRGNSSKSSSSQLTSAPHRQSIANFKMKRFQSSHSKWELIDLKSTSHGVACFCFLRKPKVSSLYHWSRVKIRRQCNKRSPARSGKYIFIPDYNDRIVFRIEETRCSFKLQGQGMKSSKGNK